ncbi:MAG: hypothetical protein ABSA93_28410 [Streptosporangiaceae bacterium]|jgi:TPR repeat protein
MTMDDRLATAAASISAMPAAETERRLDELQERRRIRTRSDAARHAAELDESELDWAAYELARHHDDAGDLAAAARWYRLCASADLGDAALRLARVLDRRAGQRVASPGDSPVASQRDELALVSDAARWYIEAYGAGHVEAAEELDGMISRHDIRRRRDLHDHPVRPHPAPQACPRGGLDTIIETQDLVEATKHFKHCIACQREFVSRGGILPNPAQQTSREELGASDSSAGAGARRH